MTIFAGIKTTPQLENAAVETLQAWLPTYLAEIERQLALTVGFIEPPRFYGSASADEFHPEESAQAPGILVVSPGTDGEPEQVSTDGGELTYASWFQLSVVAAVHSNTEKNARALAGYYAAAIRGLFLQQPALGGFATGMNWTGEEIFGNPETQRDRQRAAAFVHFRARVEGLVTPLAGPLPEWGPPDDPLVPYEDWSTADTVDPAFGEPW